MFSLMGYHTFAISMSLTQEEAGLLFKDFKRYRDKTDEICIIECPKYKKDPFGRHYEIKYSGEYKGISWKMRFSNRGFMINDKFMPCSVKAIINPKIFTGEKSYIIAAHACYLEKVERVFNVEAQKISPMLKRFDCYSLNRLDYCINVDVSEMKIYPAGLKEELPEKIMELIKYGDIPKNFSEEYKEKFQFYLKSGSVVINCYWKYFELSKEFDECIDLKKSYDIIRFEVQYKYPKVCESLSKIKKEFAKYKSDVIQKIRWQAISDIDKKLDGTDIIFKQTIEMLKGNASDSLIRKMYMMSMMSDDKCMEVIKKYINKTIKRGTYYTFDFARRKIEADVQNWEKVTRLTNALQLIRDKGGIARAKACMQDRELEEFRGSLRDLARLGINPVTIPKEWGIQLIPNLLDAYYNKLDEEQVREKMKSDFWGTL
ncbi:MAG: hypothetical protein K2K90_02125 [Lachnospiraceae bacterium]|nr:hypothetical protein [Lachnospiraceae bacterium]